MYNIIIFLTGCANNMKPIDFINKEPRPSSKSFYLARLKLGEFYKTDQEK